MLTLTHNLMDSMAAEHPSHLCAICRTGSHLPPRPTSAYNTNCTHLRAPLPPPRASHYDNSTPLPHPTFHTYLIHFQVLPSCFTNDTDNSLTQHLLYPHPLSPIHLATLPLHVQMLIRPTSAPSSSLLNDSIPTEPKQRQYLEQSKTIWPIWCIWDVWWTRHTGYPRPPNAFPIPSTPTPLTGEADPPRGSECH